MNNKKINILVIGLLLGLLLALQTRSFEDLDNLLRDAETNVFQEIQVLKDKNEDLKKEIQDLEENIEELDDQDLALGAIEKEIEKYKVLSGKFSIFGPGMKVTIKEEIPTPWVVDLVNEFWTAGAEAVSVNGIRIVNHTSGFDTLPNGQILLNGSILTPPFEFNVIGEASSIREVLEAPGGIFKRMEASLEDVSIFAEDMTIIQML